MPHAQRPRSGGFSLIELLVVMAIIAVLIGLLLAAVQKTRASAARVSCSNNLKQIGLALNNYQDAKGVFPAGTVNITWDRAQRANWAIEILPYIEQENLHRRYDNNQLNHHASNASVYTSEVRAYFCPADVNAGKLHNPNSGPGAGLQFRMSSYKGMSGRAADNNKWHDTYENQPPEKWRGLLHGNAPGTAAVREKAGDIHDGHSNTIALSERHVSGTSDALSKGGTYWAYAYASYSLGSAVPAPHTLLTDYIQCAEAARDTRGSADACKRGWGSFHNGGGINAVYIDGSVRVIPQSIDMNVWVGLATIAGGEVVPNF